jgi:predicted nucleic acid-binding protein
VSGPIRRSRYVFVDTSGWAALANERDSNHPAALAVVRNLATDRVRLITSNFVVAETHGLIVGRVGRWAALQTLLKIEAASDVVVRVSEDDERRARKIIVRYDDKDFSYIDATSFAVMERLEVQQAFAFDRHFAQFGFRIIDPMP